MLRWSGHHHFRQGHANGFFVVGYDFIGDAENRFSGDSNS